MAASEFEHVIASFSDDLYRFAVSLTRNGDTARDLVQQAFVVFAEKGDAIREPEKRKNWLFTTLYREFLRTTARERRVVAMEDAEWEQIAEAPEAQRSAEHGELLAALGTLEDSQRAILSLFYLDQHSYRDIAEILEIPVGTVMSRLSRAKTALRERLEAGAEGINPRPFPSNQEEA